MGKMGKTGLLVFSLFVVMAMLCSCGSTLDKSAAEKGNGVYYNNVLNDSQDATEEASGESAKASSPSAGATEQITKNRKIIEYVNLTVETKVFDKLIEDIDVAVKQSGGYMESSEIGGNRYYTTDSRTAELKIRIPKTKQSDFSDFILKNSNVVNRSVSTEDVTDRYIDTQSRIKALTLEKETLEKLLMQSSNISDTLTVYERLTNVIAEIESYQGKLNQMDNLIEYTTFTVYIIEVEKETNVEKQSWFGKTWNGLLDNFYEVGNGLLDFLSFVIVAVPYLILIGILVVVIVFIIRRIKKKREQKSIG